MKKYCDPRSPIVQRHINNVIITNTLIDLVVAINVIKNSIMDSLHLSNPHYTPIVLQLADRSIINLEGILEDIIVSIDSWEYPVEFMILQPKTNLQGYHLILGRPWLGTIDAYIGCRSVNMIIKHGYLENKYHLYPPVKTVNKYEIEQSLQDTDHQILQLVFNIDQALSFKDDNEENQITNYITNSYFSLYHGGKHILNHILDQNFQETYTMENLFTLAHSMTINTSKP
jgi:hypothetical protein